MNRIPVLMDCDPGTDDALAILMMFAADNIDVRAITTVAGNVNIGLTTGNALRILDYFGLDAPVAAGAYPLMKPYVPAEEWINGPGGLGRTRLPEATRATEPCGAVELMRREIVRAQGELHILATGPLTNVALLLCTHPELKDKIKHITLMGGALIGGNTSPCAEFNIFTDPDAAKIVFQSGVPLTMVGLDVCYNTQIMAEELDELWRAGGKAARFVCDLMGYPPEQPGAFPADGIPIFDALAAAAVIDPGLIGGERYAVAVEAKGELTAGQTVVDTRRVSGLPANALVAMEADRDRFWEIILRTVALYDG